MVPLSCSRILTLMALLVAAPSALAQSALEPREKLTDRVSTFTLSSASYVSFQGDETIALPVGSTLLFRFGSEAPGGRLPFTIAPGDVRIPSVKTRDGRILQYSLAGSAFGSLFVGPRGVSLDLSAVVTATLESNGARGSRTYPLRFTTEETSARDPSGVVRASATGAPMNLSTRHVVLVAAAVNSADVFPAPGKGVQALLAGTFDRLPEELQP